MAPNSKECLRPPLAAALLVVALAPSRATAQPTAVCHPSVTVTLGGDGTATLAATTVDNGSSDASGRPLSLSVTPSGFDCADVDSSPALAPDGTLYFGSDDRHLYALRAP